MPEPDAAVAIVQALGAADSVLLMRRAERNSDSWSGHWSFPGGRRETKDADLLHTALRELEEECGIPLVPEQLHAALPLAVARRRVGRYLTVAPFVFAVDFERPVRLDSREAVEAVWTPLSVLRDTSRHALRPVPGRPPEMWFPAIDLHGVPLWGFTYRLIADWLDLIPGDGRLTAPGFQVARALLEALVAHGCVLDHDWVDREGAMLAALKGPIPVELVLGYMSMPAGHIPWINMLEARLDGIRLVGLAFEEYRIESH
jgi:8-oxo-dGTP pyrophosphatase MutT (NUDIX family)